MEWKEVFCPDYISCFPAIVKHDFKIGFDWLSFITNYYILTWKVKVSAVAKFITVKLNFELSPVSKDKSWVGTFACNRMYLSAAVDVPGVLVIRCPRGVTKTVTLNRFTSLTFTASDCAIALTLIVFTSLVLKREAITTWPVVLAFVFRERLKGMT